MYTINLIKTQCWNPLFVGIGHKTYELGQICLYDKNGIIIKMDKGWFGDNGKDTAFISEKPLVKRIKENFSKNEPFILKQTENTYSSSIRYILYIPISSFKTTKIEYKKSCNMIRKYIYTEYDDIFWSETVKVLDNYSFRNDIEELCEILKSPFLFKEEEIFQQIEKLKELYNSYFEQKEYIKNYTVEDYLKEIKEVNN